MSLENRGLLTMAELLGHSPGARCSPCPTACCLLLSFLYPMASLLVWCLLLIPSYLPNSFFPPFSSPSLLLSRIPLLLGQIHHYEYIHLHLPNILLFHEVFPAPSIRCKHFLLRTLTALWISLMPLIIFCYAVFLGLFYCMPLGKKTIVFISVLHSIGPSMVPCTWW